MKCRSHACDKKRLPQFVCIKCRLEFCSWRLLFIGEDTRKADGKKAQCLCCFLGMKRTPKYRDAAISDTLAQALSSADAKFRDRVIQYKLEHEKAERRAFSSKGPDYFWPGMAPPPDADVKKFMIEHSSN